uniref:Solute carrier family 19 member 2 n=1 Tax=Neolamprologus brichardi TaxID=32507 RepID=A0A3Q4H5Z2_NEOBR
QSFMCSCNIRFAPPTALLHMSVFFPTVLLCVYGFFTSLRPCEPFLTAYLMGPDKNLTETQVVNEIFPVWTYSYLFLLFPIFLATDFLCYKPVLVLQASSLVVTYVMLWRAQGLLAMQLVEFFFGLSTASEVAYYSYIYSVVEPEHYQRVTAYCRSVTLFGSAAGSLTGQLLVSVAEVDMVYLVIITLASASVAFLVPCFLPMPKRSLFFHRRAGAEEARPRSSSRTATRMEKAEDSDSRVPLNRSSEAGSGSRGLVAVLRMLFDDFVQCYRCRTLLAWSLWWALATCGYFQIINYSQPLWETLCSPSDFLSLLTRCDCSSVHVHLCYSRVSLRYQVAASLNMQRYALVFGVNSFVALLLQSLLTLVVVDSSVLGLKVFTQFFIYGAYFAVISAIFLFAGLYKLASRRHSEQKALPGSRAQSETDSPPTGGTDSRTCVCEGSQSSSSS